MQIETEVAVDWVRKSCGKLQQLPGGTARQACTELPANMIQNVHNSATNLGVFRHLERKYLVTLLPG